MGHKCTHLLAELRVFCGQTCGLAKRMGSTPGFNDRQAVGKQTEDGAQLALLQKDQLERSRQRALLNAEQKGSHQRTLNAALTAGRRAIHSREHEEMGKAKR